MNGPQIAVCDAVHATKYRAENENFRDSVNRVSSALSDNSDHYHELRDILGDMRFMPAGRVQAAMGASRQVTPYNCFVSGNIHDSFVHGNQQEGPVSSIMGRAMQAATTMRSGGGIGYSFGSLRPEKALIKKLGSQSSGPISFMRIYNEVCLATSSAGHRRGAQMGVLPISHPDIRTYIKAKQVPSDQQAAWDMLAEMREIAAQFDGVERARLQELSNRAALALNKTLPLQGFNISVGVTDEFMECLAANRPFRLHFAGESYGDVDARELWEELMRSTWDWAEPGVLYLDRINRLNNLWYCEEIFATNPCGEQPLPPHGACLLGSFNLVKYLLRGSDGWGFDFGQLEQDVYPVVRAMDNVVDRALYPLPEQQIEAQTKRRMGLGVTGLANAVETILGGASYGDPAFLEIQDRILDTIRNCAYDASVELASEKGPFPLFDAAKYCESPFIKSLPNDIQESIRRHGIRNSHLTSIAPTGTISFAADNVSSSIEPVFDYVTYRSINMPDGPIDGTVDDYGVRVFGTKGRRTDDVTARQHVDVLTHAAVRVDSAVSKTCNVPGNIPWEDFKGIYLAAYEGGAKGCTTFNKDGKRIALLVGKSQAEEVEQVEVVGDTCAFDPATGRKSCE